MVFHDNTRKIYLIQRIKNIKILMPLFIANFIFLLFSSFLLIYSLYSFIITEKLKIIFAIIFCLFWVIITGIIGIYILNYIFYIYKIKDIIIYKNKIQTHNNIEINKNDIISIIYDKNIIKNNKKLLNKLIIDKNAYKIIHNLINNDELILIIYKENGVIKKYGIKKEMVNDYYSIKQTIINYYLMMSLELEYDSCKKEDSIIIIPIKGVKYIIPKKYIIQTEQIKYPYPILNELLYKSYLKDSIGIKRNSKIIYTSKYFYPVSSTNIWKENWGFNKFIINE